jgi:hypothetical protein
MANVEDPIPVGHVAHRIAFQHYHGCDHEPLNDQALIDRFRSHLESGELCAAVRDPHSGTQFAIPPEAWRGAWYARPFFFKTILGNENENGAFEPYARRTPYVSEEELSAIIDRDRTSRVTVHPERARQAASKRPRTREQGRFASADEPLLNEMRRLMSTGEAATENEASLHVAREARERAKRDGPLPRHLKASPESIARRLRKHYSTWQLKPR